MKKQSKYNFYYILIYSIIYLLYFLFYFKGTQHGIVFCKNNLDINSAYVEFKINMNIPCRGKSHLFIGLVDRTKYKLENLCNKNKILNIEY